MPSTKDEKGGRAEEQQQLPQEGKQEDVFEYALNANAAWAAYKSRQNPTFFTNLAKKQSPSILWIGCADSRVPETTILGLQPGDAFVHRNIANIVVPTDVNTLAVVEFAVAYVKVKHIILCGHTSCAGCAATLAGTPLGLLLDSWLTQLRILRQAHEEELASIEDVDDRAVRLAELNVERGISNLMSNSVVQAAVRERGLQIHGTIYNTGTGRLRDLGLGTAKKGSASLCPGMASKGPELLKGNHGVLVFAEGDVISLAVK